MRIRFLSHQIYETEGPGKGPSFVKGFVLDGTEVQKAIGLRKEPTPEWVESFMSRWTQRGVAEYVEDDVPTGAPTEESENPYAEKTIKELQALAVERGIDLGDATKKADIIAAIQLADEQTAE